MSIPRTVSGTSGPTLVHPKPTPATSRASRAASPWRGTQAGAGASSLQGASSGRSRGTAKRRAESIRLTGAQRRDALVNRQYRQELSTRAAQARIDWMVQTMQKSAVGKLLFKELQADNVKIVVGYPSGQAVEGLKGAYSRTDNTIWISPQWSKAGTGVLTLVHEAAHHFFYQRGHARALNSLEKKHLLQPGAGKLIGEAFAEVAAALVGRQIGLLDDRASDRNGRVKPLEGVFTEAEKGWENYGYQFPPNPKLREVAVMQLREVVDGLPGGDTLR